MKAAGPLLKACAGQAAEDVEHPGELDVAAGADVVDLAPLAALDEQPVGADDVADVGEVAHHVEVADLDPGLPADLDLGHLPGEAADDINVSLAGTGVVERPGHDDVGAVGQVVLDAQDVGGGLAGGVRVVRAQGAALVDR